MGKAIVYYDSRHTQQRELQRKRRARLRAEKQRENHGES